MRGVYNAGWGAFWEVKTPDRMAKERADRGKGEEGARAMERDALDEQDREFFAESELSGIYSRSQYLKVLFGS